MKRALSFAIWTAIALLGAWGYYAVALGRSERINSGYVLLAALSSYAIGYRFYSKWVAASVLALNDRRATPSEVNEDGKDFVKTNKWIVFGHHFAAISGPGPLVGPVLAAQFGFLPGTLWILVGVVLGGAVQDFVILFSSMRRRGKSLGQMVKEELNTPAGYVALIAILAIMIILLAVLALVVVRALAESPWGVFTVGATIPIAMLMGGCLRFWRVGRVMEVSIWGVVLLLLAVWGGQFVQQNAAWARFFGLREMPLALCIILYGLAASVLPVWLLLAPRDYLSTFMKLGTIFALVVGVFWVLPELRMPRLTPFVDGSGPVVSGKLFPFCFITIACGAISGFHTLISSGTTPKLIGRESHARTIGYGAMCLESLVAIVALIAACTLEPGVYLSMNVKVPGPTPEAVAAATIQRVEQSGFHVTRTEMDSLAAETGEKTLFGRTGGAATLAVGMARIFSEIAGKKAIAVWYHFAIMFEALFILTTLDAGTRVGRYLLQDFLGHITPVLGDTRDFGANLFASALTVGGWGYFLIQGVRDPLGGINSLWPLFGIANQLLAAIALCLATTIILKMHLAPAGDKAETSPRVRRPVFALVTLVPLIWLLSVTMSAGWQKIFHHEASADRPRIGFLQIASELKSKEPALVQAVIDAGQESNLKARQTAENNLRTNRVLRFNNLLDAVVAGVFLILVACIVLLSLGQWGLLLARRRAPTLHEEPPVWRALLETPESGRGRLFALFTIALGLARELSDEAALSRSAGNESACCAPPAAETEAPGPSGSVAPRAYGRFLEERYRNVRRCC